MCTEGDSVACVVTKYVYLDKTVVKPGQEITVNMRFGDNCPLPQLYDAYCYLDGEEEWHDWGFILPYTEEDATCKVKAPNQPGQHTITVQTNQEQDDGLPGKSVTFVVVSGSPPPDKGLLQVQTTPEGAKITVNGKFVGYSPVSVWLPQGWYTITASLKGYQTVTKNVYVIVGKVTKLNILMKKVTTPKLTPALLAAGAGIAAGVGLAYVLGEERMKKGAAYARSKAVSAYSRLRR